MRRVATALALNGSPSPESRTRVLAQRTLDAVGGGRLVDLTHLDAEALLGRRRDPTVDGVLEAIAGADVLIVATPVYRATYSALTKTVFDLLPQDALRDVVAILAATGAGQGHRLAVDHGLRPLIASLGGWSTPTGLYATTDDVDVSGYVSDALYAAVQQSATEARALASAIAGSRLEGPASK
jgi:FMN reductase